jgi:hypothetical protein
MEVTVRTALALLALSLVLGCASRADQVFTAPGRLTTGSSGAQPGYAIKLVQAKQAPTDVVADDGSLCRLTAARFAQVQPGEWIACDWTIATDTIAAADG